MGTFIAIVAAAIFGLIGRYVAKEKNRDVAEGFIGGFFLGPIGIIIVALLPNKEKVVISDEEKEEQKRLEEEVSIQEPETSNFCALCGEQKLVNIDERCVDCGGKLI